jgi:hypothetical protein
MAFHDDEYGCLCSGHDDHDDRCFGCGSRDVSGSIGGDPYCGDCFDAERADRKRRKEAREIKELAAKWAEVDKLLSAPCPVDPRC